METTAQNSLANAENKGADNISDTDKKRLMQLIEADERGELKYSTIDEVRRRFSEHMAQTMKLVPQNFK